jgi:hypothetical protein
MGYRLKKDNASQLYQLARDVLAPPERPCYGASGWVQNPPQDTSGSSASFSPSLRARTTRKRAVRPASGPVAARAAAAGPSSRHVDVRRRHHGHPDDGSYTVTIVYSVDGHIETRNICADAARIR